MSDLAAMLVERRARFITVARHYAPKDVDPEDCVQEACLLALRGIGGFRGEAQLSSWFNRIVINVALGKRRKKRPTVSLEEPLNADSTVADTLVAHNPSAYRQVESAEQLRLIWRLRPVHREILFRKYLDGETAVAIARDRGVPVGTVKAQISRAKAKLRELVAAG
jgi:RNA polymerase sigma-70 factor (ECF subfamily)